MNWISTIRFHDTTPVVVIVNNVIQFTENGIYPKGVSNLWISPEGDAYFLIYSNRGNGHKLFSLNDLGEASAWYPISVTVSVPCCLKICMSPPWYLSAEWKICMSGYTRSKLRIFRTPSDMFGTICSNGTLFDFFTSSSFWPPLLRVLLVF